MAARDATRSLVAAALASALMATVAPALAVADEGSVAIVAKSSLREACGHRGDARHLLEASGIDWHFGLDSGGCVVAICPVHGTPWTVWADAATDVARLVF